MNDAIGNQIPLAIGSVFLVSPYVTSGRLRAIAVTSAKPDPKLPGAEPIANQTRVRGLHVVGHLRSGQHAAGARHARLRRARQGGEEPRSHRQALRAGIDVLAAPPGELDAFVKKEIPRWAKVTKDNNIKLGD